MRMTIEWKGISREYSTTFLSVLWSRGTMSDAPSMLSHTRKLKTTTANKMAPANNKSVVAWSGHWVQGSAARFLRETEIEQKTKNKNCQKNQKKIMKNGSSNLFFRYLLLSLPQNQQYKYCTVHWLNCGHRNTTGWGIHPRKRDSHTGMLLCPLDIVRMSSFFPSKVGNLGRRGKGKMVSGQNKHTNKKTMVFLPSNGLSVDKDWENEQSAPNIQSLHSCLDWSGLLSSKYCTWTRQSSGNE